MRKGHVVFALNANNINYHKIKLNMVFYEPTFENSLKCRSLDFSGEMCIKKQFLPAVTNNFFTRPTF